MKRLLVTGLIAALLIAAFMVPVASARAEIPKVGLSLPSADDAFYMGMGNGALAGGEMLGYDVFITIAEGDVASETANVQLLIDEGVEALLISPVDLTDLSAIELANEAGIPVFLLALDEPAELQVEITSAITTDYEYSGSLAGSLLCAAVEQSGTVIALFAEATDQMALQRAGFESYMAEGCPDVSVVALETAEMDQDAVKAAFTDLLGAHDVAGVFAQNAALSQLALETSMVAGQRGLKVVGFEASDETVSSLEQGLLTAVVTPVGWWFGEAGVTVYDAMLNGEEIEASLYITPGVMDMGVVSAFRGGGEGGTDFQMGGGRGESDFQYGGGRGGSDFQLNSGRGDNTASMDNNDDQGDDEDGFEGDQGGGRGGTDFQN